MKSREYENPEAGCGKEKLNNYGGLTMGSEYTVTVGEKTFLVDNLEDWLGIAAAAQAKGQKAYLVSNFDNRVIAEA